MSPSLVIGIDFGGVLSVHDGGSSKHTNTSVNMDGAIKAIIELSKLHKLHVVSFCGKTRAIVTKASLDLSEIDGLFSGQFYVKNKDYKLDICNYLGCHFMIDDRIEILDHIKKGNKEIVTIWFEGDVEYVGSDHLVANGWAGVIDIISKYDPDAHNVVADSGKDISKLVYLSS